MPRTFLFSRRNVLLRTPLIYRIPVRERRSGAGQSDVRMLGMDNIPLLVLPRVRGRVVRSCVEVGQL
jgi:hypothetical protein